MGAVWAGWTLWLHAIMVNLLLIEGLGVETVGLETI